MFESFEQTTESRLTRTRSKPKIGPKALVVMSTNKVNGRSLQAMYEMAANGCTRVLLPEWGKFAHAADLEALRPVTERFCQQQ